MEDQNQSSDNNFFIKLGTTNNKYIEIKTNQTVFSEIKSTATWPNNKVHGQEIIFPKFITNDTKVNDVCRYSIIIEPQGVKVVPFKGETNNSYNKFIDKPTNYLKTYPVILLLLESPHQKEYFTENSNFIPIAPAQEETGENIHKNLHFVLEEINRLEPFIHRRYRLIICNPIQYQTSLYVLHQKEEGIFSTLRDNVWKEMWNYPSIWSEFDIRFDSYKPYLVINACTYNLKNHVNKFLDLKKHPRIFTANHPATWKGFNIEKHDNRNINNIC